MAFSIISYGITEPLLKLSMLASGELRASGGNGGNENQRGREMVDGISTLFHLLYGWSTAESCLPRHIQKRVKVDPGGGEAGLIWEYQRLPWTLTLNVLPEAALTYR